MASPPYVRKPGEVEIPKDRWPPDDCFNLEPVGRRLGELASSVEQQAFVISLEAPWGSGKTTFLRALTEHLKREGHPSVYFSAWEVDFVADPFEAFVGETLSLVEEYSNTKSAQWRTVRKRAEELTEGYGRLITHALPGQLGDAAREAAETYKQRKLSFRAFGNALKDLAESLVASRKDLLPPVVFLVDELDRCRPDFALRLLERIKHLFAVEGVLFILALDRSHLHNAIKKAYGTEIDAPEYLRRFIDLALRLPEPDPEAFARSMVSRFLLADRLDQPTTDTLAREFSRQAHRCNSAPRAQAQVFTAINLLLSSEAEDQLPPPVVYLACFVAILRAAEPDEYRRLRKCSRDSRAGIEQFLRTLSPAAKHEEPFFNAVRVALHFGYMEEGEFREEYRTITPGGVAEAFQALHQRGRFENSLVQRMVGRLELLADLEERPREGPEPASAAKKTAG